MGKCGYIIFAALFLLAGCFGAKHEKYARLETGGVIAAEGEMQDKDKFFRQVLFPELMRKNYDKAQALLDSEIEKHPDYQKEPLYFSARGLLSFGRGNYKDASTYAGKVINIMEQRFAPKKPYQISFQTEKAKNSVAAHYLYRYQALMKLGRYNEALEDVKSALKINEKARILLIKSALELLIKRYDEAAKSINKAYKIDPKILIRQGNTMAMNVCTIFYEHEYLAISACKDFFSIIEEKKEESELISDDI